MPTYLKLPPEQGGTRFGPFPAGIVQLGTEASQCQLVLSPTPGLAPVHASITSMGGGRFTVQPVQQGLGLFLVQRGQTHLWPVEAPVTAGAGDKVILGSAEGPCFELEWQDAAPGPVAAGPTTSAARAPTGGSFPGMAGGMRGPTAQGGIASGVAGEMQRQAFAKVLGRAGPMRDIYHMYYRVKSGALTNPRVLVSILGTVFAGFLALATGCAGIATALVFGD